MNGTTYDLLQFHFHTPSEHTVDGNAYPAEVHFVHAAEDGSLAVIGVFIEDGAASDALAPFWDDLSAIEDAPVEDIDVDALLPGDKTYYTYNGSLTTPPCSEIVTWLVMQSPITMSTEQLDALRAVHDTTRAPCSRSTTGRWPSLRRNRTGFPLHRPMDRRPSGVFILPARGPFR